MFQNTELFVYMCITCSYPVKYGISPYLKINDVVLIQNRTICPVLNVFFFLMMEHLAQNGKCWGSGNCMPYFTSLKMATLVLNKSSVHVKSNI